MSKGVLDDLLTVLGVIIVLIIILFTTGKIAGPIWSTGILGMTTAIFITVISDLFDKYAFGTGLAIIGFLAYKGVDGIAAIVDGIQSLAPFAGFVHLFFMICVGFLLLILIRGEGNHSVIKPVVFLGFEVSLALVLWFKIPLIIDAFSFPNNPVALKAGVAAGLLSTIAEKIYQVGDPLRVHRN